MKKLIFLILFNGVLINNIFAVNYSQDSNCQGAWIFEEGSGASADDVSQNANIGTFKGDNEPTWTSTNTYSNYYVKFDGSNDYIDCTNGATTDFIHNTEDFSIVFWINYVAGNTYERYFCRTSADAGDGWQIMREGTNGPILIVKSGGDGDYLGLDTGADDFPATWTHIVVMYDWSEDKLISYYNGTINRNWTAVTTDASAFGFSATANLYIGARGTDASTQIESGMDETGLFNRLLDSTEINDIMDNGLALGGAPPVTTPAYRKPHVGIY